MILCYSQRREDERGRSGASGRHHDPQCAGSPDPGPAAGAHPCRADGRLRRRPSPAPPGDTPPPRPRPQPGRDPRPPRGMGGRPGAAGCPWPAARAHIMGCSMGGMIVQRMAIHHPDRLLSMTSVMSRTGEPGYGESSPEAFAILTGKPAKSREEYIERQVAALHVYGSKPEWLDD